MTDQPTDEKNKSLLADFDRKNVADFVSIMATCPKNAPDQLKVLLRDMDSRWHDHLPVPIEEYFRQAPELAADEACRKSLLRRELSLRQDAGDARSVDQFLAAFPELLMTIAEASESPTSVDGPSQENQAASPPAPRGSLESHSSVGQRMGRYILDRLLGEGSFGSVYLATDTELDRKVAIKVLHTGRFSTQQQARSFLEEASSTAKLSHPSIVTLHDIGKREDDSCFAVMEYVAGQSMAQRLADHSLPLAESIEILAQVALALGFAHRRGFVHRDLKPANILIDAEGRCRVADFGLALHEDVQRMKAGEVAGTPAYMSPEQVRGESHLLDGRTDIWSLGVILYQVLTDRMPFRGITLSELFDDIQHRRPRPPRQVNKDVLPILEQICLKCLAPEIDGRYRAAEDVAAALQSALPLLEPVSETPVASRAAFVLLGIGCLIAGGIMCFVGGLFYWVTWMALYGPIGTVCNSSYDFQEGLIVLAFLSSPLFVGLPLMIFGLWLSLVHGGKRGKARSLSGKAVASLAIASMTPFLSVFACVPALLIAREALREIRRFFPRVKGRIFAYLGVLLAIAGTVLSLWLIARAWVVSTAYQAYDRGQASLKADDVDNAIFEATLATNRFPKIAIAWKLRGEARLKRMEPKLAVDDLSRAISIYSPNATETQQNKNTLEHLADCYELRAQAQDQLGITELALEDRKLAEQYRTQSSGKK